MIGERSVWGYFALAIISLVLGTTLVVLGLGERLPAESDLKKVTGFVKTVVVIDSFSGESTALSTPLNEIHFTLHGIEPTFRFPNGWPGYSTLYDRLAFDVDVWIDPKTLTRNQPVTVYRLEQRLPEGWTLAPISISYQAIVDVQHTGYQSYLTGGISLLFAAPVLFTIGGWMVRRNRRNRVVPKAD